MILCVVFCKQKTAYEMRISDWSSEVCSSDLPAFATRGAAASGDDEYSLEQRLSERVTLRQHLTEQMQMEIADPTGRAIGVCLIDQLDDNGYLTSDLAELAAQLGCADRKSTRLNSSHSCASRMPSSA